VSSITSAVEPALRCWDAIDEVQDIEASLSGFQSAGVVAERERDTGDHMSAWFNDDGTARRALRGFGDAAEDGD
jgi:hypothetical protein